MSITFLGSDSQVGTGSDFTITFTPTLQEGDIVVVAGGTSNTHTPGVTTAGYTDFFSTIFGSSPFRCLRASYKIMGATPDTSVTVKGSTVGTTGIGYVVYYFRGAHQTTQPDATAATATASGAPDAPSITTVTDGAVVIALACSIKDTAITAPSGYSDAVQADTGGTSTVTVAAAWKAVTSHGAENPAAWTDWNSAAYAAATIAIRPAPTASGTASLGGSGTLSLTGTRIAVSTIEFAGVGALDAATIVKAQATVALGGSGSLFADGLLQGFTAATTVLAGVGSFAADAQVSVGADNTVAFAGAGSLVVSGSLFFKRVGFASFAGEGALTATPSRQISQGRATMAGDSEFAADGEAIPSTMVIRRVGGIPAAIVERRTSGTPGDVTTRRP